MGSGTLPKNGSPLCHSRLPVQAQMNQPNPGGMERGLKKRNASTMFQISRRHTRFLVYCIFKCMFRLFFFSLPPHTIYSATTICQNLLMAFSPRPQGENDYPHCKDEESESQRSSVNQQKSLSRKEKITHSVPVNGSVLFPFI